MFENLVQWRRNPWWILCTYFSKTLPSRNQQAERHCSLLNVTVSTGKRNRLCVRVHACAFIYIYIYKHTHTHTHTQAQFFSGLK